VSDVDLKGIFPNLDYLNGLTALRAIASDAEILIIQGGAGMTLFS
jgi:hypothetical protein